MYYQIELKPIVNDAIDRSRLAYIWVNNSTWNGGGQGSITITPAHRVGRIGYGTVQCIPRQINLFERGECGRPLVTLFFQGMPTLYLRASGTGSYNGPIGGRLPIGGLEWEVISVM